MLAKKLRYTDVKKITAAQRGGNSYDPKLVVKKETTFVKIKSQKFTNPASNTIAMSTTIVESTNSLYFLRPLILGSDSQGQLALRSSLVTSLMNLDTFTGI